MCTRGDLRQFAPRLSELLLVGLSQAASCWQQLVSGGTVAGGVG